MPDPHHPKARLSSARHASSLATVPVLVLLGMAVLAVGVILFTTAQNFDAGEAARTEQRVTRMMAGVQANLGAVMRDYAGWDAAVEHLVDTFDLPWADENVGVYLSGSYRLTMSLVMDRQGRLIYGMDEGKRLTDTRLRETELPPAFRSMAEQAAGAPTGATEPASGIVRWGDQLYLVSAADVRPTLGDPSRPDGVILAFLMRLDRVTMARLLDPLLLENIDITIRPPMMAGGRITLAEYGAGEGAMPAGWVTWRLPRPAQEFLASIYWVLGGVFMVLFLSTLQILIKAQRAARQEAVSGEALRQLSERYRGLIDTLPDMVCLLVEGRIALINAAGLSMLGLPTAAASQVVGKPFLDLVAEADRLAFHRATQMRGRAASEWTSLNIRTLDGTTVPIELAALPVTGEPLGEVTLMARDRRPELARRETLRAAETRAAVADRAKGQFLANISHELRTPLNAIIGFSEILRDELLGGLGAPQYKEYAIDIHEGGLHLLRLVNDLLDIARMDAGTLELREGWVDIAPLVERCERLLRQKAAERGVPVKLDVSPAGLRVLADEVRLKQIIVNLLGNSIRFSEPGRPITVTVRLDGPTGDVLIEVADRGIGMSVDAMRIALEPFAQVEGGHSRRQPGAGLGLPLAKGYAEAHGGSLTMQSSPAVGTTVTVRLPAVRAAQVTAEV